MQPLNRFQFFREIMSSQLSIIRIDVTSFNQFARKIEDHGFICDFDYEDLHSLLEKEDVVEISSSSFEFKSSEKWIKRIKFFAKYYDEEPLIKYNDILKVWEEVQN